MTIRPTPSARSRQEALIAAIAQGDPLTQAWLRERLAVHACVAEYPGDSSTQHLCERTCAHPPSSGDISRIDAIAQRRSSQKGDN